MDKLNCYVDGSYNETTKQASWAFVIVKDDKIFHKDKGIIDGAANEMRQIFGECNAVIKSLEWAKQNNVKLVVHFDYVGLKAWLADLWDEKPWKTNKEYTILYREKVLELRENLESMVKVKAHGNDRWNNYADQLAKIN